MTETVRLHIRRVTFEGLPARHSGEALAAFRRELARLLTDQPSGVGQAGHVRLGPVAPGSPAAVGEQMAHTVYERVRREEGTR
jgi:hypothetical protein